MSRTAARITHDEVTRILKAVTQFGLSIDRVKFDGETFEAVINNGDIVKTSKQPVDKPTPARGPLRPPVQ